MALHHAIHRAAFSSQGSLIVAAVLVAFVVYATLRGHLAGYLNDLGFGAKAKQQAAVAQAQGSVQGGIVGGSNLGGLIPPGILTPPINPNAPPN